MVALLRAFLLLLLLVANAAFAQTSCTNYTFLSPGTGAQMPNYDTLGAACSAYMGELNSGWAGGYTYSMVSCSGGGITYTRNDGAQGGDTFSQVTGSCPPTPAEAADRSRCSDASAINNSTIGISYEEVTVVGQVSSGTSICAGTSGMSSPTMGCTVNFTLDIGYEKPDGTKVSRGTIDTQAGYTTLPCDMTTTDAAKPKPAVVSTCPAGEQIGQINGFDICKPYAPGTKATAVEKVDTSKAGTGATITNRSTSVCSGTTCTTTTITSSTANSTVTTATSTVSKGEFCAGKPASKQCDAETPTGGGGESGGCLAGADTIGCSKFGEAGAQAATANSDVALTFSRESGFGASNGTCPAPRVLNIPGGRTISMSFDMYCSFAQGMRPFIIGFALLSAAGMVVFGATRKG